MYACIIYLPFGVQTNQHTTTIVGICFNLNRYGLVTTYITFCHTCLMPSKMIHGLTRNGEPQNDSMFLRRNAQLQRHYGMSVVMDSRARAFVHLRHCYTGHERQVHSVAAPRADTSLLSLELYSSINVRIK